MAKFAAIDLGFAHSGVAICVKDPRITEGFFVEEVACFDTKGGGKNRVHKYKAEEDIARAESMISNIRDMLVRHSVEAVAVEIPTGGAQGARANRAMGVVTGTIAALRVFMPTVAFEWIIPDNSKKHVFNRKTVSKQEVIDWADSSFDIDWPKDARGKNVKKQRGDSRAKA